MTQQSKLKNKQHEPLPDEACSANQCVDQATCDTTCQCDTS